ncbi:sodium/sugar symporter [Rheinheimera sp.]|uniref:sodium/sugar symporter n=1 Tax=Rheinheimera sp. TaxID=1869214 RepID=UPI003AF7B21B
MVISALDSAIVIGYVVLLLVLAMWVSKDKAGHQKDSKDFFLAGQTLPWWAIGASLIAANISAEQIIGMSGSGFVVGLAIASYEWMAALTLLLVGWFFLPVFLRKGIYTMPQFLEQRFDKRVKYVMSLFWLLLYTFVNLTAVLWLGATAIATLTGLPVVWGMLALALIAVSYSLYGGLKAVALTDGIQILLLVGGGLLLSWIALNQVSDGAGVLAGFDTLLQKAPEKFDMILAKDHPEYANLPGMAVILGGMWMMNLSYWGFNQYIIQRALAAKSFAEAQKGILFAAFLKMLMPVIIVLPGIAAYVLSQDPASGIAVEKADAAYPTLLALVPEGIRGLIFAALIAAIVSSLASMMNSIATIFTLDLYKPLSKTSKTEQQLVGVGRLVSGLALLIAVLVAKPLLGNFPQAFQYIQEFTGFFTPGICAIFMLGIFWKGASGNGALAAALLSCFGSLAMKLLLPEVPFMDRVGYIFLLCCVVIWLLRQPAKAELAETQATSLDMTPSRFYLHGSAIITMLLVYLYWQFW